MGLNVATTQLPIPAIAEVAFDSAYKFMVTFYTLTRRSDGKEVVRCFIKGAPDVLVHRGASHGSTAGAIADQLGISGSIITGAEMSAMIDERLRTAIDEIGVISPGRAGNTKSGWCRC